MCYMTLTASIRLGGFSSIPLTFTSTHTHRSSSCKNTSLSICCMRLVIKRGPQVLNALVPTRKTASGELKILTRTDCSAIISSFHLSLICAITFCVCVNTQVCVGGYQCDCKFANHCKVDNILTVAPSMMVLALLAQSCITGIWAILIFFFSTILFLH